MNKIWDRDRKLVIGIDIGATSSAVTFVYLAKGQKPLLQRVTKWPGQLANQQECRLPSWIWYDAYNKPVKIGAEAVKLNPIKAKQSYYQLAKHFKLHLHPANMTSSAGFERGDLPRGIKLQQIYTDYLAYLFKHAQEFFVAKMLDGQAIWDSLASCLDIVIAHPNGWGTKEQGVLREAAIGARLVQRFKSDQLISFVSEAEASIQFCLNQSTTTTALKLGMNLVVCDAGGSTVDTTVYTVTGVKPMLELKEIKASACIQAGGIFVDAAAEDYLRQQLQQVDMSSKGIDAHVEQGMDQFTNTLKPIFTGEEDVLDLKIGGWDLELPQIQVDSGQMELAGFIVKGFFDFCVSRIHDSVFSQSSGVCSPEYFLVGGFGDSPYLQSVLKQYCGSDRLTTSNEPRVKAVADGAAIWAVARSVVSRAARYSYGICINVRYDPSNSEHARRGTISWPSGLRVTGAWSEIVAKDRVLHCEEVVKLPYIREYAQKSSIPNEITTSIYSTLYDSTYKFMCNQKGDTYDGWDMVCTVSASFQNGSAMALEKYNSSGNIYWELDYNICIKFGGTQLQAYVEWVQNGMTKHGKATIIPAAFN